MNQPRTPSAMPDVTPSPQLGITFLDMVRTWLFFAIPIYARTYLSMSFVVVGVYFLLTGGCVLCLARFKNDTDGIAPSLTWDATYGLIVSMFPFWAYSGSRLFWFGPAFCAWRFEILYWMLVLRQLVYFLPERYGSDVELLIPEYNYTRPRFSRLGTDTAALIVSWVLWPKSCPWYHVLLMFSIVGSAIEYVQFAYMNHMHIQKHGKTVRQDDWPYKDLYTHKWTTDARGNRYRINHTLMEWLLFLSAGDIELKTRT